MKIAVLFHTEMISAYFLGGGECAQINAKQIQILKFLRAPFSVQKLPLKMSKGFEAQGAHPRPKQIWVLLWICTQPIT